MNERVELLNVAYLKKYQGGFMPYRFPLKVINKLGYLSNIKGKDKAKLPSMVELYYCNEEPTFNLTLKAVDSDLPFYVFVNDFQLAKYILKKGRKETYNFQVHERFKTHFKELNKNQKYSFKIIFSSSSRLIIFNKECVLLNKKTNLPYILYGSSISQGVGASDIVNSYAYLLSQNLKVDILNKGLSGSCLLEKETIDYLSSLDTSCYILEIGCNVRGIMDKDEFQKRFNYLLNKIALDHLDKKIFIISMLDVYEHLYKDFYEIPYHQKNLDFIKIIKQEIKKINLKNIYLISSKDLIKDIKGISQDLLHPSNLGHYQMAYYLAKKIKKVTMED